MSNNTVDSLYSTCTVLRECGISARQLYYWELTGLVRPRYENFGTRRFRRFTEEDLQLLKRAKALIDEGFTLQAVRDKLGNIEIRNSKSETNAKLECLKF